MIIKIKNIADVRKSKLFLYTICLASGILTALPAIFGRLFIISWLSPALMYAVSFWLFREGSGGKYLPALLFSFGFYGAGYSFVFALGYGEGDVGAGLLITAAWAALSLIQAALVSLHLPLAYRLSSRGQRRLIFAVSSASVYALLEIVLSETRYAIPWMNMALTQVYSLPIIQVSSLFGGPAVAMLVMLVSCLTATVFDRCGSESVRRAAAAVAVTVFSVNVIGGYVLMRFSSSCEGGSIRAAAVGCSISMKEKNSGTVEEFGERYAASAAAAAAYGAELIVFPETAIPYDIVKHPNADAVLAGIAEEDAVTLISGVFTQRSSGELCNALVLYSPDGERTGAYVKRHLVPVSEFSHEAFEDSLSSLLSPFGLTSQRLAHGDGGLLVSECANVGGIICFDSLFWDTAARDARDGAELLAVSANDSVLGGNFAERIHLSHAVLRSVESRRYSLRASTGGATAVIGPDGGIRAMADSERGNFAVATIERSDGVSLFCLIGPYTLPLCVLGVCIILYVSRLRCARLSRITAES